MILRCVVVVSLVSIAFAQQAASQSGLFLTSCTDDAHIAAQKRTSIERAANDFVKALIGDSPQLAYDTLSETAKANVSQQQFLNQSSALRAMEVRDLSVAKSYLVHITGQSPGRVVCGLLADDQWDSVAANGPEQAHVVVSGATTNNRVAFAIWLIPNGQQWQVQSYWMNIATLADKGPAELRATAREQENRKHYLNAALLYAAAMQIANRGPNFQMGITQSLSSEMTRITVPKEIQGQPPFTWGDETLQQFEVLNIGPLAIGGKLYIAINHRVHKWATNEQVDGWNKKLIGYFKARFPEYKDSFAGLVVRAIEEGTNRGYGTVEED